MLTATLALGLGGCADMSKQDIGVLTGAAAGGLLGSQFGGGSGRILATIGGAVAGGFIGGAIGRSMDKTDYLYMNNAMRNAPPGEPYAWNNPNGNSYVVTPRDEYVQPQSGQPCRDYAMKAQIAGKRKPKTIYGTACRMNDGTWRVVS
jgi:surface antigen